MYICIYILCIYIYIHIHIYIYTDIYIYIERERAIYRERDRDINSVYVCIYIYIYIYYCSRCFAHYNTLYGILHCIVSYDVMLYHIIGGARALRRRSPQSEVADGIGTPDPNPRSLVRPIS